MPARGFRSIGRQWTEVTADAPDADPFTFLGDDGDDQDDGDELAQRRGRRPGRPHSAQLVSSQEDE